MSAAPLLWWGGGSGLKRLILSLCLPPPRGLLRLGGHGSRAQADDLDVALGEFRLHACHGAQFGGADRREVFGVREQDGPTVADPVVKVDRPLRGFSGEIGGRIVNPGNAKSFGRGSHDHLLSEFQMAQDSESLLARLPDLVKSG